MSAARNTDGHGRGTSEVTMAVRRTAQWKENLRTFMKTGQPPVPHAVSAALQRHAPLALAFLEFSRQLREENKQAPYPAEL